MVSSTLNGDIEYPDFEPWMTRDEMLSCLEYLHDQRQHIYPMPDPTPEEAMSYIGLPTIYGTVWHCLREEGLDMAGALDQILEEWRAADD